MSTKLIAIGVSPKDWERYYSLLAIWQIESMIVHAMLRNSCNSFHSVKKSRLACLNFCSYWNLGFHSLSKIFRLELAD
jgi:hypothetical protein